MRLYAPGGEKPHLLLDIGPGPYCRPGTMTQRSRAGALPGTDDPCAYNASVPFLLPHRARRRNRRPRRQAAAVAPSPLSVPSPTPLAVAARCAPRPPVLDAARSCVRAVIPRIRASPPSRRTVPAPPVASPPAARRFPEGKPPAPPSPMSSGRRRAPGAATVARPRPQHHTARHARAWQVGP